MSNNPIGDIYIQKRLNHHLSKILSYTLLLSAVKCAGKWYKLKFTYLYDLISMVSKDNLIYAEFVISFSWYKGVFILKCWMAKILVFFWHFFLFRLLFWRSILYCIRSRRKLKTGAIGFLNKYYVMLSL